MSPTGSPLTSITTSLMKKTRGPRHCRKCHRFLQGKHECTEEERCTSWETCPTQYRAGHVDVKKRVDEVVKRRRSEEREKERVDKEKEREEEKHLKRCISEMLRVKPSPDYETFFDTRLKELVESNPESYNYDKNSDGYLAATRIITDEWAQLHRRKQAEKRLKEELKKRKKTMPLHEQVEFLSTALGQGSVQQDDEVVVLSSPPARV